MRIDYSEPKKSYTSPQTTQNRPRREPSSGSMTSVVIITCLISLGAGFGSGWMLSQKSAKKGFKAAMEQQSLENAPRPPVAPPLPPKPQIPASQVTDAQQQQANTAVTSPTAASGPQPSADPQLSFYKNLPSGQKSNVLGSGINAKEEKSSAKQPLQAAVPSNIAKPIQPQNPPDIVKQPAPAAVEKPAGRQDVSSFTVQVSSFSLKSEAETLKNKLAGKGYYAYIVESNQGSKGIWYRVRVGKALGPEAAKELATRLGKGSMAIPEKD